MLQTPDFNFSHHTIGWLNDKAASRFEEVTKLRPELRLITSDGCLLSLDDAVCNVLNNNDSIVGQVVSWKLKRFSHQYIDICLKENTRKLCCCGKTTGHCSLFFDEI